MASYNSYIKNKDLIGKEINGWKILDIFASDGKHHHAQAIAQCHCGTIKEIRLSYIVNNYTKDCGCGHNDRLKEKTKKKYEHLIGTQINGWVVLDIVPHDEEHKYTSAVCQCKCGTIKNVRLTYLINGKSKNCGCGRKQTLRETRTKNLVGQRFGKLVAVELLEDSDRFNRRVYRCKCDCGRETTVSSICLTTNHTLSCGCLLSYYNMYIDKLLDSKEIYHKTEHTVYIDGHGYRFDFYLPEYNLFIEYDGEHHFKPVNFGGMSDEDAEYNFILTQKRDKIKNKYCKDNNIHLLRIPYWENKNIETIISNHLQRLSEKGFAEQSAKYATV